VAAALSGIDPLEGARQHDQGDTPGVPRGDAAERRARVRQRHRIAPLLQRGPGEEHAGLSADEGIGPRLAGQQPLDLAPPAPAAGGRRGQEDGVGGSAG
jgi:hypothetical protein